MTSLPTRAARRARTAARRSRRFARDLSERRHSAHRLSPTPRAAAFAAYGTNSLVVPPARVENPHRIALGHEVCVLEFSTLCVTEGSAVPTGPLITIGDGVFLARFCSILSEVGVTIGDRVASSDGVAIIDTWRPPFRGLHAPRVPRPDPAPVVIGPGAYLGMSSIIGPGVHVGEGAYVGENSVVVDDVPPHTVVYGNPAVVTRRYDPDRGTWEGREWP